MYIIKKFIENQDSRQYVIVSILFLIDFYKITVSTLLLMFVPQQCGQYECSFQQNIVFGNNVKRNIGIVINFTTMFFFVLLYIIELSREKMLIKYLEVNPNNPRDNDSLSIVFEGLPKKKKRNIYFLDYYYQVFSWLLFFLTCVNIIISYLILYNITINYQAMTILLTYLSFSVTKLYELYYVAFTDKNIFYSAYLKDNVQFNDVSLKYKIDNEAVEEIIIQIE
jgi:hypothetical protein